MKRVPATVVTLGLASLLTDLSAEMIFPLLPAFLTRVLGAGPAALGLIEGVAEATAATFKILAGVWTDATKRRKPLVVLGYAIAGCARPLVGLAQTWVAVLVIRFADRVGKGIRTSPRDALIADVTVPESRGAAYGLHRAMDHSGAVVGPLIAAALLHYAGLEVRTVMLLAAIPAALVIVTLLLGVKELKPAPAPPAPGVPRERDGDGSAAWADFSPPAGRAKPQERARSASATGADALPPSAPPPDPPLSKADLPRDYRRLLLALFVGTLGNSTDAFLLLNLQRIGVPLGAIALLWSLHHVVRAPATWWGGRLVDRFGPRRMLLLGWGIYAAVYAGFALAATPGLAIGIFLSYGLYYGFAEPAERVWIASLAPARLRGTAFGVYHAVTGVALLPASVLFGLLWNAFGPEAAFLSGAVLSAAASALLLRVRAPVTSGAS